MHTHTHTTPALANNGNYKRTISGNQRILSSSQYITVTAFTNYCNLERERERERELVGALSPVNHKKEREREILYFFAQSTMRVFKFSQP